jgi:hypothetical protein
MKSLIFFSTLALVLFFSGCVSSTLNKVRYQSVSVDQATILQSGKDKESCAICGMHLPTFYKTNHVGDTKDGVKQYCSLHCVVKDNEFNKTDLTNLRVVDTKSLKFIPVLKAFYVVGSSKKGTMSRVSKYAFAKKEDADNFAKEFGGKVMKFYDAYDEATKDFTKR